jgi:hypothetical protein
MPFPWWAWVLIAIAVALIGFLKVKVWRSMGQKKSQPKPKDED